MTARQIADIAGCSDNTVRKIANQLFPNKRAEKRGMAKDYQEVECYKIMDKLPKRNNVELKTEVNNDVAMQTMQMFKMMMDQQQIFMTTMLNEIKGISKPQLSIEAPKEDYFSLLAYCSLHKIKTNRSELAMHGRELRKMVLSNDMELRKIPDERYGEVNSYPVEILDEYFTV
jgi:hypothetical protein